jgi:MraZ protein
VERDFYEGSALQAVDEKGRVAIPADLRAAAERNSDTRIIVVQWHPFDPCLSVHDQGYTASKFNLVHRPDEGLYDGTGGGRRAKRQAFGGSERAPFDSSGRFVLPPFYRSKAKIGRWAFFTGAGDTFDIWSPEALMQDETPENALIREYCAFALQQKGVAA